MADGQARSQDGSPDHLSQGISTPSPGNDIRPAHQSFTPPPPPAEANGNAPPVTPRLQAAPVLRSTWPVLLVWVGGWGGILLILGLFSAAFKAHPLALLAGAALASLGLFFWLEQDHWLSRRLGLRVGSESPTWESAVALWLFGVFGLLFRSVEAPPSEAAEETPAAESHSVTSEAGQMLGWVLGLALVLVCGWVVVGLGFYLDHRFGLKDPELCVGIASVLSLALFLVLEYNHWLSRLMGLWNPPGRPGWKSAIQFWALGVPGLLFRSTGPQTARAETTPGASRGPKPATDSTREVVETVVFVVVLVLLLKSFAAEAFVIPTGSMAQTLYGYQKLVTCPACGTEFPVNCSVEVDPTEGTPTQVIACTCPNCRQKIHFPLAPQYSNPRDEESYKRYLDENRLSWEVPDPGPNSGDRVLVSKGVYSLFDRDPNRLDVVVFKFPGDSRFPISGPYKNYTPMNYIKRLIGLPGETIAIWGGKLYYLPVKMGLQYDDAAQAANDPNQRALLWRKEFMHQDDPQARERFGRDNGHAPGQFRIIRKEPDNILAMMRPVYDNDHPANNLKGPTWQRWMGAPGSAWKSDASHGFAHDGSGDRVQWLRYRNVLRDYGGKSSLISDFMGYNSWVGLNQHSGSAADKNWASDLILECEVAVERAEGEFLLELSRGVDRFQARWDLASGACTLWRLAEGKKPEQLASRPTPLKGKGTYQVRLANVDEKLTLWVDGRLPFGEDEGTYAAPGRQGPTRDNDLDRPASIGSRGAAVRVSRLKLFRDTYYTTGKNESPANADVPGVDFTDPTTWESLKDPPLLTLYVQPGHFLCLGDNSQESSDGRTWGAVPRRLLLGRAILVYYPFSRAGRIR